MNMKDLRETDIMLKDGQKNEERRCKALFNLNDLDSK